MSVINQVLKDLDKRGASSSIGEATIRVVHGRSQRSAFILVAVGAVGMLAAASAVWLLLQGQQPPIPAKTTTIQPLILPASQVAAAPVLSSKPQIASVVPEQILASGVAQLISINGSNFRKGASVSLYDDEGRVYENRPLVSFAPAMILLKLNLGRKAGKWQVEVNNNDGTRSGKYSFAVSLPEQILQSRTKQTVVETPARILLPKTEAPLSSGKMSKQPTQISLPQQAENEFQRSLQLVRQGHNTEAMHGFENVLKLDAGHEQARQNMVALLLEKKRNSDAEKILMDGIQLNPKQSSFAMLLARIQVERNAIPTALETLLQTLPYAEKQADYQSFVAALMQRQNRNSEAIEFYRKALQLKPNTGIWLMGMGISLRAEKRDDDARDIFKRALLSNTLNSELRVFVTRQLQELRDPQY